jgi:hypothetical protein
MRNRTLIGCHYHDDLSARDLQRTYGSFMSSLRAAAYRSFMNHDRVFTSSGEDRSAASDSGRESTTGYRPNAQFQITVISTTPKGTLAALKTAARLAKNVDAPITLAMVQVLRPHLSLDAPPLLTESIEKHAFELVSDAGIREQAVTIQIWFCHDRNKCLRQALGPRTLAVVGGRKRWWQRDERKLEEWLCREGFPTIFADVDAKPFTELLPKSHRRATLHRVMKRPDNVVGFREGD